MPNPNLTAAATTAFEKEEQGQPKKYLRRSWTGQLIDVAEIDYRPDAILIHRLHCTGNAVDENPAYARQ